MATIVVPSTLTMTRFDMGIHYPGQEIFDSYTSGATQRIVRGPGYYAGVVTFAEVEGVTDPARVDMEVFLAELEGIANDFLLEIPQPATTASGDASVGTVTSGDDLYITVAGLTGVIEKGRYIRVGERLYQCKTSSSAGTLRLAPNFAPRAGDAIVYDRPRVKAHLADTSAVLTHYGGDFVGPWTLKWREVVDGESFAGTASNQ